MNSGAKAIIAKLAIEVVRQECNVIDNQLVSQHGGREGRKTEDCIGWYHGLTRHNTSKSNPQETLLGNCCADSAVSGVIVFASSKERCRQRVTQALPK
eukprot:6482623-Amphidinium_carterae.1